MEWNQAHTTIYNHLLDLHQQDPDFRFLLYPCPGQPFKGEFDDFWGIDNSDNIGDNKIIVSVFNSTMKSYGIVERVALHINLDRSTATLKITFDYEIKKNRMDPNKVFLDYFERMAHVLGFVHVPQDDLIHNWEKQMPLDNDNYIKLIDDFIEYSDTEILDYISRDDHDAEWRSTITKSAFEENIALNEGYTDIFLNEKNKIERNCLLKYLHVKNYQGIKSLTINSLPNDAQWIFLTGENGFGKTSILRAIAKGLVGDESNSFPIGKNTEIISTMIDDKEVHYHNVKKGISPKHLPNVLAYGSARFNTTRDEDSGSIYTLFKNDGYLLNIEKLLETAVKPTFEKINTLFKKIIPNLADIKKVKDIHFYEIRYQETNDNRDMFEPVKLSDLAAGYRGIIIMIGDMIRRFNPYLEKPFDEISGIVIIDEFDAHLHPKYQYELPNLLSTVFPKIQFIVSTHSPIPLLGVEPNTAVVLTVNRTEELGITVERLDDDIEIDRLSANSLLSSDIFGFKSIFARGATPDTIRPFNDYKDIKEMSELEKRLELKQGFKDLNIKIA